MASLSFGVEEDRQVLVIASTLALLSASSAKPKLQAQAMQTRETSRFARNDRYRKIALD